MPDVAYFDIKLLSDIIQSWTLIGYIHGLDWVEFRETLIGLDWIGSHRGLIVILMLSS